MFLVLLILAGCRKSEPVSVPKGYRDSYALAFNEILPKTQKKLIEQSKEAAGLIYVPSFDPYLSLSENLCWDETELEAIRLALHDLYNDASLTSSTPNEYTISFESTRIECKYKPENGAICYIRYDDGVETSFVDFVPLENNLYACQTPDSRFLIEYSGSDVLSVVFSRTRYSLSMNPRLYEEDIIEYNALRDSAFNAVTLDASWVTERMDDLMQIAVFRNGILTISNRSCEYEFNDTRDRLNRKWAWDEDIIIESP